MPNERTERVGLPDTEAAKLERRVIRAIRQGANVTQLLKMGVKEATIRKVAAAHGLEIKKGVGGNRL